MIWNPLGAWRLRRKDDGKHGRKNGSTAKADYLRERLEWSLSDVARKRRSNQFKATGVKIAILSCSAGATILLGLSSGELGTTLKNIALALTASVTALTALEPFFNYRALWVLHEGAKAQFHTLSDELHYLVVGKKSEQISEESIDKLFERYQQVWDELSSAWIKERKLETKASSAPARSDIK